MTRSRAHRATCGLLLALAFTGAAHAAKPATLPASFAPTPGGYPAPLAVTLASATPGAAIHYTLDGAAPTRQSPRYVTPVVLAATTTVSARAFAAGRAASPIARATYTLSAPPPETGGTLFVASLTPQPGATTAGAGAASLTLTADLSSAYLRYSQSGLTGPRTGAHVHAGDGTIVFDVDTAPRLADGALLWTIRAAGTFDAAEVVAALRDGECYLNLHTAIYPAGEIKGFLRRASGSQTFTPPAPPPPLPATPPSAEEASRFLHQATFGPRLAEIAAVQARGYAAWLDEQIALPRRSYLAAYDALAAGDPQPNAALAQEALMEQAVQGDDPLRQRLVLALSELFVVSAADGDVRNEPAALASYLDTLGEHAFGNFRELLEAVTLAPAMGVYLDMARSTRELPELGRKPNENYAREILQLFSIGLYQLHPDGTLRLDADNQPIATYDQATVEAYARAFTGWTFGGQDRGDPRNFFRPVRGARLPMEPWELFHDSGEKVLLDGARLPAAQGARVDLEAALDTIAAHPNVGPFLCRYFAQRLVTSNPSPGYVYRCAQAFADDGTGERGDLAAVVRAILLDPEARLPEPAARQDFGHLREPAVRLVGLLRTLDATPRGGRWRFLGFLDRPGLSIGQTPLRAPSVFNFFEPGYALPGEIAQAGLVSPEFQVVTDTTVVGYGNLLVMLFENAGSGRTQPLSLDLTAFQPPQARDDAAVLDAVDLLLFAGGMPEATRATLAAALGDPAFPRGRDERVERLLWLASLAPEVAVQR
jgi:uncharacterized protein (DUF1800 family)